MTLSSIAIRLHLITIGAAVAIGILVASMYALETFHAADARMVEPRAAVDAATAIASTYAREEASGRLSRADAQKAAAAAIATIRHGANETVWVTDAHPSMIVDPARPDLNGTDLANVTDPSGKRLYVDIAAAAQTGKSGPIAFARSPRDGTAAGRLAYVQWFQPWGWVVAAEASTANLPPEAAALPAALPIIAVMGILAVAGLVWWLGRGIVRSTQALSVVAKQLADGNFTDEPAGMTAADEMGDLARAMELFRRRALERFRVVRSAQEERAARDRRQAAMDQMTKDFGVVISTLLLRLAQTAEKLPATAREIADLTFRSRETTVKASGGAAVASGALAKAGLATVTLANGIEHIGRHAAETTAAARNAAAQAAEAQALIYEITRRVEPVETAVGADNHENFDPGDTLRENAARAAAALRAMDSALATLDSAPEAISALCIRQAATVRGFASGVQGVARAGGDTASALAEIETIADRIRLINRALLADAEEVGQVAGTLRGEAEQFFKVVARSDQDRRRFERMPGHGAIVTLAAADGKPIEARLENISRGGASLRAPFDAEIGELVTISMTRSKNPIAARIVRCVDGVVGLAFRLDDQTMAEVDAAIDTLA